MEVAVWQAKLFHETLVTQLLARNTSVALTVAMLATKSLITFNTHCHSIAGAVPDGWFLLCRLGEAVALEARPVCQCPGISRKQTNKLFLRYRYLRRRRSAESHKHKSPK